MVNAFVFGTYEGRNGIFVQELDRRKAMFWKTTSTFVGVVGAVIFSAQGVDPSSGFFTLVTFLAVAVCAAASLLVVALMRGFWMDKKRFLAVLVMLVIGAAIAMLYWTLVSTGYQDIGVSKQLPRVSAITVDILGRLSSLMFLLLLSLFTCCCCRQLLRPCSLSGQS